MHTKSWIIEQSSPLRGSVRVDGAKNAVLVIIASLIVTRGKSCLYNVPPSSDVYNMISLLECLGARVSFDSENHVLSVDTVQINNDEVPFEIMQKMRASILVMGPLLSRMGSARVYMPGGCVIGKRPIDMHLRAFERMGVDVTTIHDHISAVALQCYAERIVLDYPSVGATENALMLAVNIPGEIHIVNAAVEPEVLDLIDVLRKMGAIISVEAPATLRVHGVRELSPINHTVIADRLEAGTILLATAATHGSVYIPNAPARKMEVFLEKLCEMGHTIRVDDSGAGVALTATSDPHPIAIRTMPYPGFPTDLQAPTMAVLTGASGQSTVWETVYENRMLHVSQLNKLGAHIVADNVRACIYGCAHLHGDHVTAPDIRGGAALLIAGMMASGTTVLSGVHHLERGHGDICNKLQQLGACISENGDYIMPTKDRSLGRQVRE